MNALMRWDPFRELEDMSERLNRVFNRPAARSANGKETITVADWIPTVDIAETEAEYQIKAAFLYKFGRFVEWPPEAFSTEDAPLRICVAGENPFGSDLEETVRGKAIAGHPVHAVVLRALNEARNCHLIFVSSRNASELKHILEATMRGGVLVVSEAPESAAQGAMINFVLEDERVRCEINDRAAVHTRLKISSKLLKLAKTVIE